MNFRPRILLFLTVLCALPLAGCLSVRTPVAQRRLSSTPLLSATQGELIDRINGDASKLQSMQATVDLDTSVGGEKTGAVTDYTEIRGYVLARKPSMLRMIGLLPVVRNKAFDMVSNGETFQLWIPPRNKFVTGKDTMPATRAANSLAASSPSVPDTKESLQAAKLENLRPQHIYEALLIREIDAQHEVAVLENGVERVVDPKGHWVVEQPNYAILVLRQGAKGWYLSRKIVFSRVDLQPHRQMIYDESGVLVTDVAYEKFALEDGVMFPRQINISRPQEEYRVVLNILKLQLNLPLPDDKFQLDQPAGATVVNIGAKMKRPASPTQTGEHSGSGN